MDRPYENEWSSQLKLVKDEAWCVFHLGEDLKAYDYDPARSGGLYKWQGLSWERNPEKYNSMWRLHDLTRPGDVIWADVGNLTVVPEDQAFNAALDPWGTIVDFW